MTPPLQELKILDFTTLLPGPYGSMMLADMGADIIKIENPGKPDMARLMPPYINDISAFYAHINRGKRSLALDLKRPEARDIIFRLAKDYDVILEQFRPGVMARLGLGYDDIRAVNGSIIYCSLTGYGQSGPMADRAGHDINYMALSGIDSYSGKRETGPSLSGIQIADICGGSKNLVIGVLAACIKRMKTGQGSHVDISITDSAFALSVFSTAGYLAGGAVPGRESELLNGGSLYDYYMTADGRFISVGPLEQKFFTEFCSAMGYGDAARHGIMANCAVPGLKKKLADTFKEKPLNHWVEVFKKYDACVEPVLTVDEAAGSDLFLERGMIVSVRDVTGTEIRQVGNPVRFDDESYAARISARPLGYDTIDILRSLDFSDRDIHDLRSKGVIS